MKSDFACEYKVNNGKITEFNQYTDTFVIGQVMGLKEGINIESLIDKNKY